MSLTGRGTLHKPRGKTYKEYAREVPLEVNVQELTKLVSSNSKRLPMSKADACFHLWNLAVCSSDQRDEMLDLLLPQALLKLITTNPDETARFNAAGCLQMLSTEEEGCLQISEAKVGKGNNGYKAVASLMVGTHDRTKVSAAAILYEMSTHSDLQAGVLSTLPIMLRLIDTDYPEWAGLRKAHAYVATAIRNLVFLTTGAQQHIVLRQLLATGAVSSLVSLIKRGPKEASTASLACIQELVHKPAAIPAIVQAGGIPNLVTVLTHGVEEQKVLAAGTFLELSMEDDAQEKMVDAGVLIPLSKCLAAGVRSTANATGLKKKRRGKAKSANPAKRDPALPALIELLLSHAAATLHNLSFIDEVKVSIRECGAIPLLVALLNTHSLDTQESIRSTLWNLGLEPSNREYLTKSQCPHYLISPLHPSWLTPVEKPQTQYAGGAKLLAASKPRSAPTNTTPDGMEFRRMGGGAMHGPRTPEEDAQRNKTPPRRTAYGNRRRPINLPKVAK